MNPISLPERTIPLGSLPGLSLPVEIGLAVLCTGIVSAEAFGSATITKGAAAGGAYTGPWYHLPEKKKVYPLGIETSQRFGRPEIQTVGIPQKLTLPSIVTEEVVSGVRICLSVSVKSIRSKVRVGGVRKIQLRKRREEEKIIALLIAA